MLTDKKVLTYNKLVKKLSQIRNKKRLVVTTGAFDIFHAGHLAYLDYAKRQGDILVVGIATDKTIREIKGPDRPIIPEDLRVRLIAGLEVVDFVVLLKEPLKEKIDNWRLFEKIQPDIWVVPYSDHNMEGNKKIAKQFGIKLIKAARIKPGRIKFPLSTTYILERLI